VLAYRFQLKLLVPAVEMITWAAASKSTKGGGLLKMGAITYDKHTFYRNLAPRINPYLPVFFGGGLKQDEN